MWLPNEHWYRQILPMSGSNLYCKVAKEVANEAVVGGMHVAGPSRRRNKW